ncbi:helix-turn-helix domain-containing protein [Streptomyces yaizuensis]|uniref:Scr1 family TA system antitoxin-like transcriptional regulator n=1 Tax=Streptomyces yaizuensis TaxID=2989713 RepID=A0ABQ5P7R4_9ACTN|nr:helix-turn-helix transcriptional regulator [Streptomyces sp. YSPA8]GLF98634.1 Scr1 family TA system antitoxin-like transcriptional regulator [Streptomyces sp. YSPA8]
MLEREETLVNRKELNPEASPCAAYGARLRSSREARGWTQDDLAELMTYSGRHISAVETARKPPTRHFSLCADAAFGLENTTDTFERAWREIRTGALLEGFPEYVAYEARAIEIRLYEVGIIPGLLQIPAYARAMADGDVYRGSIPSELADERVAFVAERQAALARSRPPMMFVVMDQSCIRRQVGGPEVMRAQYDRLLEFAEQPNAVLQIATDQIGERRPFNLPINLLTLADWTVMAYAESQMQGYLEREITAVRPLLREYHQLQAVSASQAESLAMIRELRKGTP